MNAGDLHKLARMLREIATAATANPGERAVSPGLLALTEDISRHPDGTIGDVAQRTGLAQSFVSKTVARLRDAKVLSVRADPNDGRRILVSIDSVARQRMFEPRAHRPIDAAIQKVSAGLDADALARVLCALDVLADELLEVRK